MDRTARLLALLNCYRDECDRFNKSLKRILPCDCEVWWNHGCHVRKGRVVDHSRERVRVQTREAFIWLDVFRITYVIERRP